MRLLLDTNTFAWITDYKKLPKLGPNARRLLEYSAATYVSTVSLAELRLRAKAKKGRLPKLAEAAGEAGLEVLDVLPEHADAIEKSAKFDQLDQFDRILLAQAQTEQVALMTSNESLLGLGLNYVIDARQ